MGLVERCSTLVYHLDVIASYFDKYQNVINGVSTLIKVSQKRCCSNLFSLTTSLIDIRLSSPFQALLKSKKANYSKLLEVFLNLYQQLKTTYNSYMLTSNQVLKFVNCELFLECRLKKEMLDNLKDSIQEYPQQIENLLAIMLEKLPMGFQYREVPYLVVASIKMMQLVPQ